jgi:hypothetical protein
MGAPRIVCPVCGQTYMPSEIYIPNEFFGDPKDIIKTDAGKIDFFTGSDMDLDEEFVCDNCGTPLTIHAKLSFDVETESLLNFNEDYVTEVELPKKLELEETSLF